MSQTSRKKTRRFLLQNLYARIYDTLETESFRAAFFDDRFDFDVDEDYLDEMMEIVVEHQDDIISIIKHFAPKFDIDTMLKTNILCIWIASSEMLWLKEEIPAKVSINEAIDLAKYFWDDTSKNIVNGILNSLLENIETVKKWEIFTSQSSKFFL